MEGAAQQENQAKQDAPEQSQSQQQTGTIGLTSTPVEANSSPNEDLATTAIGSTIIQDKNEVQIKEEDKVQVSDIRRIVEIAVTPYIERIAQLEETLAQKDCQLTAVFYAMKKMDEIIKKLESEQAKTLPAKNSRITQSSSAIGNASKSKRAPSAVNLSSFQTASPLSARSSSTRVNTDSGLSKSSLFNNTETKTGGKVLAEEKLKRTAQTLSRSALFDHPNNASFSKTEKIPASRLTQTKTKKETDPKTASTVTKATKTSDKTKSNSTKDLKGTTSSSTSKEIASNGVSSETTTKQTQPETILNQLETTQSEPIHPPNEINLLSDLNDENQVLDSASPKDQTNEKSQIAELQKTILDESHQMNNDDSLLI